MAHCWQKKPARVEHTATAMAYNFTAAQCVSQLEFSAIAANRMHRPNVFPTPAIMMRLLLGEQADLLLEGQRVAPTRLLAEGFEFTYPTMQGALLGLL